MQHSPFTRWRQAGFALVIALAPVLAQALDIPVVPSDENTTPPAPLPVKVSPQDTNLHLTGRFDLSTPGKAACQWSGSAVTIKFHGTDLNADLDLWKNRAEVEVDGQPTKVLVSMAPARKLYSLASGLPDGEHTVKLFKSTEAFIWNMDVYGFQLNQGATVLPAPVPARQIQVLGDSISAASGNEAPNPGDNFSPLTENAYWSYGAIAARAFDADYTCCARSGICLFPEKQPTLPDRYDKILPEDIHPGIWTFPDPQPDVVVINLGTNDTGRLEIEEESWVKCYHDFLDRIRGHSPNATLYVALGPMVHDEPNSPKPKRLSTLRQWLQRIVKERNDKGDAKVHLIEFTPQDASLGIGAQYHPSAKRHAAMADQLIAAIKTDLGWEPKQ